MFDAPAGLGYKAAISHAGPMLRRLLTNLTVANQLTFLRLVAIPFFVIAVLGGRFGTALALFLGAALTDLLDGYIARSFGQGTPLGAYLDPAADKLLLLSGMVLLTEYPQMFREIAMANRIPIWLTILTFSRDVFIVSVSLMMYLAYGISRFPPTRWGKATTLAESVLVASFLLANRMGRVSATLDLLVWITLALILISGIHYLLRTIATVGAQGPGPGTGRGAAA